MQTVRTVRKSMTTKKVTRQPTKKEVQGLTKALEDLIHYSKAHLSNTASKPGIGSLPIYGQDVYTWGNLNAAIHRAQEVLSQRLG